MRALTVDVGGDDGRVGHAEVEQARARVQRQQRAHGVAHARALLRQRLARAGGAQRHGAVGAAVGLDLGPQRARRRRAGLGEGVERVRDVQRLHAARQRADGLDGLEHGAGRRRALRARHAHRARQLALQRLWIIYCALSDRTQRRLLTEI